jgi:hypothetical protein
MKRKYNAPNLIAVELGSRHAILQSVSANATLTGTEYGGNSADAGDVHADVKEAGSSDIWGAEW